MLISGGDGFVVANGPAGLHDRRDARLAPLLPLRPGNGKKASDASTVPSSACFSSRAFVAPSLRSPRGSSGRRQRPPEPCPRINDGVRFDVLHDAPGKDQCLHLFRRRLSFRDAFPLIGLGRQRNLGFERATLRPRPLTAVQSRRPPSPTCREDEGFSCLPVAPAPTPHNPVTRRLPQRALTIRPPWVRPRGG